MPLSPSTPSAGPPLATAPITPGPDTPGPATLLPPSPATVADVRAYVAALPPPTSNPQHFSDPVVKAELSHTIAHLRARIETRSHSIRQLQAAVSDRGPETCSAVRAALADVLHTQAAIASLAAPENTEFPPPIATPSTGAPTSTTTTLRSPAAFTSILTIRALLDAIDSSRATIPTLQSDLDSLGTELEHQTRANRECTILEAELTARLDRLSTARARSRRSADTEAGNDTGNDTKNDTDIDNDIDIDGGNDSETDTDDHDSGTEVDIDSPGQTEIPIDDFIRQVRRQTRQASIRLARREARLAKARTRLLDFIDIHLSTPLELDDRGKAVIGDKLPARFRPRTETDAETPTKTSTMTTPTWDDGTDEGGPRLRQRRIDEIFRYTTRRTVWPGPEDRPRNDTEGGSNPRRQSRPTSDDDDDEAEAEARSDQVSDAADELKTLIRSLVRAYLSPDTTCQFVTLDRESAAARFLVRAKIARYHPRYPLQIALVPFAG